MTNYRGQSAEIVVANQESVSASGVGDVQIKLKQGHTKNIGEVTHVPN